MKTTEAIANVIGLSLYEALRERRVDKITLLHTACLEVFKEPSNFDSLDVDQLKKALCHLDKTGLLSEGL